MYRNNINPKAISTFFDDFFHNGIGRNLSDNALAQVPVNIHETDKHYELSVIAPGLSKEAFKVNIDRNILTIAFDHKEEAAAGDSTKWLRREFQFRSFKRSFTLNEKVDTAAITAKYNDGILTLTLPKKAEETATAKDITVE